jgi:hypothetical protein
MQYTPIPRACGRCTQSVRKADSFCSRSLKKVVLVWPNAVAKNAMPQVSASISSRVPSFGENLSEVSAHDGNQLFGSLPLGGSRFLAEHVMANVAFNHLIHEAINASTGCGDKLEDVGALIFVL